MKRSYTRTDEHNVVHEWKIDNISAYIDDFQQSTDPYLVSSKFSTGAKINDKWSIRLKVINLNSGYNRKPGNNINFYLYSDMLKEDDEVSAKFYIFILGSEKTKLFTKKDHLKLKYGDNEINSIQKSLLLGDKDKNLPDNTLTVYLVLTVYDTPVTTYRKLNLKISKRQPADDYKQLYETKMGSDVLINVGDKEFQAHKIILMARSPVLAAMFSHDMIEKKENKISIPDTTPEIFEKILKYIYTDEVTGLNEIADGLLEVADKYQLLSLKNICQESLSDNLKIENAFKLMNLADRHNAKDLLDLTIRFMASNIKNFIETQDFKNLEKSNIIEACELLKKLSSY